jgi:hypothetical protein
MLAGMQLPANMPAIPSAPLPATYEAARVAIRQCVNIDECWEWGDRAAALASYARQADDPELEAMARKIRVRAVERCGELLEEIPPAHGANRDGTVPIETRKNAAEDAGLSERQRKTALRVHRAKAADPEGFEAAVEGDNPPTIDQLAEQGTRKQARPLVELGERTAEEFQAATGLLGLLDAFVRGSAALNVPLALRGLSDDERARLVANVATARSWLDGIDERIANAIQRK